MNNKHGLNKYRINRARDNILDMLKTIDNIGLMFQISEETLMDEEVADQYIKRQVEEIESTMEYIKAYIEIREDQE